MTDMWEDKYVLARCLFENGLGPTEGLLDESSGPIEPTTYIQWLRDSYHHFMRANVEKCPGLAEEYAKEWQLALASGYYTDPQAKNLLGSATLTVGRYGDRAMGPGRGHDAMGMRLDAHHTPRDASTVLPRADGTAVAIPWDVHRFLHKVRDRHSIKENSYEMVRNDFEFLLRELGSRGYTKKQLMISEQQVHDRNSAVTYRDPNTGEERTVNLYEGTKREGAPGRMVG